MVADGAAIRDRGWAVHRFKTITACPPTDKLAEGFAAVGPPTSLFGRTATVRCGCLCHDLALWPYCQSTFTPRIRGWLSHGRVLVMLSSAFKIARSRNSASRAASTPLPTS